MNTVRKSIEIWSHFIGIISFNKYIKFHKKRKKKKRQENCHKLVLMPLRGGSSRWKGGGSNCWPMRGVSGGWPPGRGPGGRAPLHREILNFWTQFARFGAYFLPTSYWKSVDLFPIKVFFFFFFFFFFNYGIGLYENGSFIVFTLVPPRVPQGVLLRLIYYFLQVRFRKQIMQYTGAARGSIVRVKAKAGVQGAEPLGGGQGAKPPEANTF